MPKTKITEAMVRDYCADFGGDIRVPVVGDDEQVEQKVFLTLPADQQAAFVRDCVERQVLPQRVLF